jgi:hypothetical protein
MARFGFIGSARTSGRRMGFRATINGTCLETSADIHSGWVIGAKEKYEEARLPRLRHRLHGTCSIPGVHPVGATTGSGAGAGVSRRRALQLPDFLVNPVYGINLPLWDSFGHLEWDPRR